MIKKIFSKWCICFAISMICIAMAQVNVVRAEETTVVREKLGTQVSTQEELLSIIQNGGTAILSDDITLDKKVLEEGDQVVPKGKTVVIDTNGRRLTLKEVYIGAEGNLTINGGGILMASDDFVYDRVVAGFSGAEITIKDVTINSNSYSKRVAFFTSCKVKIDNATLTGGYNNTSEPCAGLFVTGASNVTINNSSITGNRYVGTLDGTKGYRDGADDVWFGAQVTAVVNNGTFGKIFANQNKFSAESKYPGSVIINNGTFNRVWVEYSGGYTANVTINNGMLDEIVALDKATPVINGGTFKTITVSNGIDYRTFIKNGYTTVKNPDGSYTVAKKIEETTTKKPIETTKSAKSLFEKRQTRFGYIRNKKKRKINVRISKVIGADGYLLKYSTGKKFKNNQTKTKYIKKSKGKILYTINKAKKGNKYYIKARAYKFIKGKKVYARWTATRKIIVRR